MEISEITEPSGENKASSVPKLEKEMGLLEEKTSESLTGEEHGKVPEGITEEDSPEALMLEERERRIPEDPAVQEHQISSQVNQTAKENALEDIPVKEHTQSDEGLLVGQCERTTEEQNKSDESLCMEEGEGSSDCVKMEVSSVEEHESRKVKEHDKGLTVKETCGRSSEEFRAEEHIRPSEDLPEEMDFGMDGERSLAKLSSLVEERTSLKPPVVMQPESFHCSVISQQSLSAPGEASSNVPSATFIPLTPKIGMGKPAISKRKFSPGRPRVKQVGPHLSLSILYYPDDL